MIGFLLFIIANYQWIGASLLGAISEINSKGLSISNLLPEVSTIDHSLIVYHIIKPEENSKQLNIKTFIENENKKTVIKSTMEDYNDEEKMMSIKILLKGIRIVLQRKFYQDHIISLENKLKKYDRKQNRLIRQQPRLLEQNKGLFYKIYQKNKVNKYIFESSIEKMYLELDNYKKLIQDLNL